MHKSIAVFTALILMTMTSVVFAEVNTQWDDVEIIVSGESEFTGTAVDPFFTSLDADQKWNYYAMGYIKIGLDVRFSEYTGLYLSMKTPKTTTDKTFGDGIVRAKGLIFGAGQINFIFDEAFFELDRLFVSELTAYAGLIHTKIGMDTSEKDWFDGHGELFINTEFGRIDENLETEFFPAGIKGEYNTRKGFKVDGGWFYMKKDLDDYNQDIQFAYVGADYQPNAFSDYLVGISSWQQKGNYFQTYWVGSRQTIDAQFSTYAMAVFHTGSGITSQGYYAGLRFISANRVYFTDVTYWYIGGNNPGSSTSESFFNTANLHTTMILDDANMGIGLNKNYTAVKVVAGARINYNARLLMVLAYYKRIYSGSGPKPGNEVDAIYRVTFGSRFIVDLKAGYIFDTEIVPGDSQAWMFAITVKAKY